MKCELCGQGGSTRQPLVNHHYRTRKLFPSLTMKVHDGSCHDFANFVARLYAERGKAEELYPRRVTYLFHRVLSLRDGFDNVFP